ncbi:MAG: hypothetical protein JO015_13110 [Verrucomicrobia bacterium]|nr:hypothetical protein [Verrucomicrobiota bacterium]
MHFPEPAQAVVTPKTGELYYRQTGAGVMHIKTPLGDTWATAMQPQTAVYAPPHWIRRSVNAGPGILFTLFCHPADSGQDYGIIARAQRMKVLIVDDGAGDWREVPNPRCQESSQEEIARWERAKAAASAAAEARAGEAAR